MSQSTPFRRPKPVTRVEANAMFDTVLDTGKISKFLRCTTITTSPKGVVTRGPSEDRTMDRTALYAVEGHADELPVLVRISSQSVAVTGATASQLAAEPFGHYAEVYIEDGNIRWTQDGTEPAPGNGEQENAGSTVKLYGRDAVQGFRARSINSVGDLDEAVLSNLTVTIWNMDPEGSARYANPPAPSEV